MNITPNTKLAKSHERRQREGLGLDISMPVDVFSPGLIEEGLLYKPMSGTSMAPFSYLGFASVPKLIDCPDGGQAEVQVLPASARKLLEKHALLPGQGTTS